MLEHLRWPHGIELDEWQLSYYVQGVIQSLVSIEEKYKPRYVVYPPEQHMYIHHSISYQNAAAKWVVAKAISYA